MSSQSSCRSGVCGVRIRSANRVLPPPGWVLPRRVLDDDTLLYVRRGRGQLTIGDAAHPVQPRCVYAIPRGVPHLVHARNGSTLEHWCLHFTLLGESSDPLALAVLGLPAAIPVGGSRDCERLFLQCVQHALDPDPARRPAMLACFFGILDRLARAAAPEAPAESAEPPAPQSNSAMRCTGQVMSAIHLMMQHLGGDLTVEELASRVSMSPSHFVRVFKRVTGSSPHAYYTGMKMERAKALIASGGSTLTGIAGQLGFTSLHHFSRTFRRYEGESPSGYARRLRAGP
ncbi:MAG: helix-turn-helix transcriptional regulator [Armatimonadetes bacterium]|nr:helix-turn-helix transcriptional regulator [Armatimonadota bacterium]